MPNKDILNMKIDVSYVEEYPCVLCGGDGSVSVETARLFDGQDGDTTCPACRGKGKTRGDINELSRNVIENARTRGPRPGDKQ